MLLVKQVDPLRVVLNLHGGPVRTPAHGINGVVIGTPCLLDWRQEALTAGVAALTQGQRVTPLVHAAAGRHLGLGQHDLLQFHFFLLLFLSDCLIHLLDFHFDDGKLNARRKLRVWRLKVTRWHGTLDVEDLVALLLLGKLVVLVVFATTVLRCGRQGAVLRTVISVSLLHTSDKGVLLVHISD